jgi:beta-phosphoglucomutase family hydrolase
MGSQKGGFENGMTPQGLIFDCDGTLVDTMPLHWRAWQRIARRYNFVFREDRFYALGGVPSRDIARTLGREQGITLDAVAIAEEKATEYLALADQIQPIEPIVRIAREHYGRIPMAVATGGSRRVTEHVLGSLDLRRLFNAIVTNEDIVNQKPAPDIFLEAARRLGVPPQFCRAYEDTDLGMQAIRAAGMEAVDVRELLQNMRHA